MRTVETKIDESEFLTLTQEAKRLGVPRSELIRTRIVTTPVHAAGLPDVDQYLHIVASVQKRMGNAIAPSQIEQCVAITLRCLHG